MRVCGMCALMGAVCLAGASVQAGQVTVIVENLAPANGTFLTPTWVGIHDGNFDIYDSGVAASPALERLAEDGSTAPISQLFMDSGFGTAQATLDGVGPIAPGETAEFTFDIDASGPLYFSYASMIIPSNDAFIANGNPLAHRIFDDNGEFTGANFFVVGTDVLDAGTEVNDEIAANTAFLGQAAPNTGVTENGVVGAHPGFLPAGSGGILDVADFANADFAQSGYPIAQIRVVPEPASLALLAVGSGMAFYRRRRSAQA
ncbi:MAG: spondin domain-containing protein [Phycisphaerae bacterium]